MTKKILSWSAVALVALIILSVAVVSCKKSETSNEDNNSVVGVWSGTEGNTDYKLTFSDNKPDCMRIFIILPLAG